MIPFDFDDEDEPTPDSASEAERVGSRDLDDAEDEDWDEDDDVADAWPAVAGAPLVPGAGADVPRQVHQYLVELSKDEIVALVERMAAQDPAVRQALVDLVATARGPTADLLRRARSTIDHVSVDAIYEDDEPSSGELGRLRDRLGALVARGHADDVLVLCQRLLRRANRAVEAMEETDDGFFSAIHHVLGVIPEALARSSLGPVEQMLWVHELQLAEEYEFLPAMDDFWELERPVDVWNDLAARVEKRLAASVPEPSTAPSQYGLHRERDAWTNLLASALSHAGRDDEVTRLYEREAEATGSYERLVRHLLGVDDLERAEHWIRQGIAATSGQWYGTATHLRQLLRSVREQQGDLGGTAALDAYEFFSRPGLGTFQALLASAEAAGQGEAVRLHALRYLETLILPSNRSDVERTEPASGAASGDAGTSLLPWLLPPTGLPDPVHPPYEQPPLARVLLDIALTEKRLDDVLIWYDQLRAPGAAGYSYGDPGAAVARAVERSHPNRAIAIWNDLALRAIARTQTEAYLEAARYLESAGRIEERRGNLAAWRTRVLELQARERRKWRLRQTLDDLLKRFPPA